MRFGILGAATITESALIEPASATDGVEVWSVAARDLARARTYADKHAIPHVRSSYQALVEDPEIDAVYVPLANSLHARWATAALDAGKHVLCEKPLTSNAPQAAEAVAVAERNDRLLVEAFHWRYHPVAERMIDLTMEASLRFSEGLAATVYSSMVGTTTWPDGHDRQGAWTEWDS
jgi:predicted dehydrogenase